MLNLKFEINQVLEQKKFTGVCPPMNELIRIVTDNQKFTYNKVIIYKISGWILLTAIPIISSLVSALYGVDQAYIPTIPNKWIFYLSLILTICTILNSIFRPNNRFRDACVIGIAIDKYKIDLLGDIQRMHHITESSLAAFAEKKRKEFEHIQLALIPLVMPSEIVSAKRSDSTNGSMGRNGTARGNRAQ